MSNIPKKLQEITEKCEKATPGPWYARRKALKGWTIRDVSTESDLPLNEANTRLIVASRTDIPRLVKALERAIHQRDQMIWNYELLANGAKENSASKIAEKNKDIEAILEGE